MTWKRVKLNEVLKHRKGFIEIDDNIEYKLCRVKVHRKGVVLRELLKGHQIRTKKQQVCKAGDFIVAEMDAKVGGYGFIPDELDKSIVSSHYFLFEVDKTKMRPQYLEVVSQLKILQDQIKAVGSTNYAAIRPANVLSWEIPLPPIEKQIEIENVYERSKTNIDKLNKEISHQLTLIENLNQAILQEAVQGKLVPQDPTDEPASQLLERIKAEKAKTGKKEKPLPPIKPEEIPFEIPENWVWCRLGEVLTVKSGKRIHASDYRNEGIPFLRSGEIGSLGRGERVKNELFISTEKYIEIKNKFGIPKQGDILIACIGGSIGNIWVVDEREFYFKDGNLVLIESIPEIITNYLLLYLKTPFFWKNTILNATDTSYNALTIEKLNDAEFPLPPLSEQQRIVAEIERQLAKTKELKANIEANQQATEQLLKALLHGAFAVEEK